MKHIVSIEEGWSAPGYRDPELYLRCDNGDVIHVRLVPNAFVQLHNFLSAQQDVIDRTDGKPLDIESCPFHTRFRGVLREVKS